MENASKALIMAAGILIGVIVLSIFAYEFISISNTGETYGAELKRRQIDEFNSQFEPYAYQYADGPRKLKAQEVVTLLHLISDWNENNESDQLSIVLPTNIENEYGEFKNGVETDFNYDKFLNDKSVKVYQSTKRRYAVFNCSIESYDKNGRIKKMKIKEIGNMIIDKDGNETFNR